MNLTMFLVQLTFFLCSLTIVQVHSQACITSEGLSGQCVSLRDCSAVLQIIQAAQSGRDPNGASKLREILKTSCTFGSGTFTVCCATSNPVVRPPTPPRPIFLPNPSPQGSPSLLPENCGSRGLVDRVINGEDAPLFAWPWMAPLEAVGENGRPSLICGGIIISERYVLTAAHCVQPGTGFTLQNVRIGEHTTSTDPDCRKGTCAPPLQKVGVEQTIIHEDYGKPFGCRNCNDIALLRLSRTLPFDHVSVQPVCLPLDLPNDLGFSQGGFNGRSGWVAGWGTTDPRRIRPADVLQQVLLPFNRSVCSADLRSFSNQNMVLCAGGRGQDTCRGDSGGPMVMANEGELKYFVVGIVSRGPIICGAANTGGLYTNINFYVPWILRNLRP